MKRDIAMIFPPPWGVISPPVTLAYLSTYLEENGISNFAYDANIRLYNKLKEKNKNLWHPENRGYFGVHDSTIELFKTFQDEIDEVVDEIVELDTDLYGFSVFDHNIFFVIELLKKVKEKKPGCRIILGGDGCHFELSRKPILLNVRNYILGMVVGEAEGTILEVVKAIKNYERLDSIKGFFAMTEDSFELREQPKDINILPYPKYRQFDTNEYVNPQELAIMWNRGCVANCVFCEVKPLFNGYRQRKAELMFEELEYYYTKLGIRQFSVFDSLINGDAKELEKLCDMIIDSEMKINWSAQFVPYQDLNQEFYNKLRKAGCHRMEFGLESGSDEVLKRMGKLITVGNAEKQLRRMSDAGIMTVLFIIIGFPTEEEKDFQATLDFVERNKDYIDHIQSVNSLHIIKETALWREPEKFNITLDGTYSFYKWYTTEGNNYELRQERTQRALERFSSLGFNVQESTLHDGKEICCVAEKNTVLVKEIDNVATTFFQQDGKEYKKKAVNKKKIANRFLKKHLDVAGILSRKVFKGPYFVQLDLTNMCNNNCVGCWCRSEFLKEKKISVDEEQKFLDYNTVKALLEELKSLGCVEIYLAGGGEPYMHPQISEILALLKKLDFTVHINTNFSLLDEEKLRQIAEIGIDYLIVSLWAGTEVMYNKLHPGCEKEIFERVKKQLLQLSKLKRSMLRPHVKIYNVINNLNFIEFEEMVKLGKEVRANTIEFVPIDVVEGYTDCLALGKREVKELSKVVKKHINGSNEKNIHSDENGDVEFWHLDRFLRRIENFSGRKGEYDKGTSNKVPCYTGWLYSRILANGNVKFCLKGVKKPVGNIYEKSFTDIWFSKEMNRFRSKCHVDKEKDPYFKDVGCWKSCDNLWQNTEMEDKIRSLGMLKRWKLKKMGKKL